MTQEDLSKVLWKNWECWAQGGLDAAEIEQRLSAAETAKLHQWFNNHAGQEYQTLPLKTLTDLGSWCLYGTHTLLFLPHDLRQAELDRISRVFGISVRLLTELIISNTLLEVKTN